MASRAAVSEVRVPRLLLVDRGTSHDVFDVLELPAATGVIRVRSPFLFEVGEQLVVRIEHDGTVADGVARVTAHTGPDDARVTELELTERSAPRPFVSG
jgi:hypothetical protein